MKKKYKIRTEIIKKNRIPLPEFVESKNVYHRPNQIRDNNDFVETKISVTKNRKKRKN